MTGFMHPMIQVGTRLYNEQRYLDRINSQPTAQGCLEWTGITNNVGYGFLGYVDAVTGKRSMMTAHRLTLMIKLDRDIAPGMNANHSCHNRLCCNPAHLSEGTQRQKIRDMIRDHVKMGGDPGPRESYNHKQHGRNYKYSEQDIHWIRTSDTRDIAARYGISIKYASQKRWAFRNGYNWLPYDPDK